MFRSAIDHMLTCAFFGKKMHTVHISINNFIFTYLSSRKCYINCRKKNYIQHNHKDLGVYIGSIDEKSPFIYT